MFEQANILLCFKILKRLGCLIWNYRRETAVTSYFFHSITYSGVVFFKLLFKILLFFFVWTVHGKQCALCCSAPHWSVNAVIQSVCRLGQKQVRSVTGNWEMSFKPVDLSCGVKLLGTPNPSLILFLRDFGSSYKRKTFLRMKIEIFFLSGL